MKIFKKGDRLRCIENSSWKNSFLRKKDYFIVEKVVIDRGNVFLILEGSKRLWALRRFELFTRDLIEIL